MPLSVLEPKEILDVHMATLRVLSETGIQVDDQEARQLLLDNDCNESRGRICLSPELVESCIAQCPSQVRLSGRGSSALLGDGSLQVHNLGGAREVRQFPDIALRPALVQDVVESTRLMDALENVTTITPLYTPRDVPGAMMSLEMFKQVLRNTTKPINGPGVRSAREVDLLVEMACVVFGDHPQISLGASPVSPLNFTGEITQVMMAIAHHGLPFGPLPCPSVGATSPMSLAGSLVLQNAELLASIVLTQLVQPGLPVVYCGRLSPLNMHSGAPIWGNPEVGILSAGTIQLGHHYGLPVNVYGLAGSGYAADMQNGYERVTNALVPALAGADELSGVGEMAGGACSSNTQIVIDNDIYGIVQRVKRGFAVNEDSLAVDVIDHAMNTDRNFLKEPHTRKYLRAGEVWQGRLRIQETGWEAWVDAGAPSVIERAQAEAQRILAVHVVEPLPDDQSRALDQILLAAQREFGV